MHSGPWFICIKAILGVSNWLFRYANLHSLQLNASVLAGAATFLSSFLLGVLTAAEDAIWLLQSCSMLGEDKT